MPSQSSNSSWSSGCPEEYRAAGRRRSDPAEEYILQGLDDALMDDPPSCPHVATMQDIARRQRDCIAGLEADMARQAHNTNNVDDVNEGLYERVSGLSVYNCQVVNDLAATRSLAAENAALLRSTRPGFGL